MSQPEKKKLGFTDKLKKMLESDSPTEKDKSIIGGKNIKFTLTGSSVHSELLVAEAIMNSKKNNKHGMPLPIICKWYNKTKTDQITEIEGITGAFYQPNADDINTYIVVEAKPILEDREYLGEPLRKEIGPLVLDKQIEEEVQELLLAGRFKIAASLESMYDPSLSNEGNDKQNETYQLPKLCSVQIDTEQVQICVQDDSRINATCQLGQFYPSIKIIKRTNNVFELYFSQNQMYRLQAQSNTHRDIITVALRMFCGKKLITSEYTNDCQNEEENINNYNQDQDKENNNNAANYLNEEDNRENSKSGDFNRNNLMNRKSSEQINQHQTRIQKRHSTFATSESYEVFVKLNELTKKSVDLEQIRDDLKSQIIQLQDDNLKKDNKILEFELKLQEIKEKLQFQLEINEQYKKKHSIYMDEKLFLTQELQVVQQDVQYKLREIDEHKQQILNLKKQLEKKKEVVDEEEAQSLKKTIQDLADRLNNQIQQNKQIEQHFNEQETKLNEVSSLKENLQNEVLHFKKKYECILQERQILIASQKSLDSPKLYITQNNTPSHNPIDFNKKEGDDSCSDKADYDTQNNLSGHNHLSQPINNSIQFNKINGSTSQVNKNGNQLISVENINVENNQNMSIQDKKIQINNKQVDVPNKYLQDIELIKNELQQKIEENHNLSKKLQQLQITHENLTQAYTQDVKSLHILSKKNSKENGNEQMLQKLVNSLTEIITEKDLAIDSSKKINKELMKRISELSQINK